MCSRNSGTGPNHPYRSGPRQMSRRRPKAGSIKIYSSCASLKPPREDLIMATVLQFRPVRLKERIINELCSRNVSCVSQKTWYQDLAWAVLAVAVQEQMLVGY